MQLQCHFQLKQTLLWLRRGLLFGCWLIIIELNPSVNYSSSCFLINTFLISLIIDSWWETTKNSAEDFRKLKRKVFFTRTNNLQSKPTFHLKLHKKIFHNAEIDYHCWADFRVIRFHYAWGQQRRFLCVCGTEIDSRCSSEFLRFPRTAFNNILYLQHALIQLNHKHKLLKLLWLLGACLNSHISRSVLAFISP